MTWDRLITWVKRFNAIAIAVVLILAIYAIVAQWRAQAQWEDEFPPQRRGDSDVVGEEYETPGGKIVAYLPNGITDFPGAVRGSNVSLVHLESGRTAQVIEPGNDKQVVSWQVLESNERAVAYLARVVDDEAFASGRADIVVGNLPGFRQIVLARNAPYADSPTVYGNTLAVIVWPSEDEARLVTVDLATMQITRTLPVAVPVPVRAEPIGGGEATSVRGGGPEAAPRNANGSF